MAEQSLPSDTDSEIKTVLSNFVSPNVENVQRVHKESIQLEKLRHCDENIFKVMYQAVLEHDFLLIKTILTENLMDLNHVFTVSSVGPTIQCHHSGCTLVHILSGFKKIHGDHKFEILNLALSLKADVMIPNSKGDLPLHTACRIGNHKAVTMLLNSNLHCRDKSNHHGITPLLKALYYFNYQFKNSYYKIVDALIKAGCDVNLCPQSGVSPLHIAVEKCAELVQKLVDAGADVNVISHDKESPLLKVMCAVRKNTSMKQGVVKILVDAGADLTIRNKIIGRTPLHLAVAINDDLNAKVLLEGGASPNVEDALGETPLFTAVSDHNLKIAHLLIKHGANVNPPFRANRLSLLTKAVTNEHADMLLLLLNAGAVFTPEIILREHPLMRALWVNNLHLVKILLYENIYPTFHSTHFLKNTKVALKNNAIFHALLFVGGKFNLNEVAMLSEGNQHIQQIAHTSLCEVQSLKHNCCLKMRKCLGLGIKGKLNSLSQENQIPSILIPTILLDEYLRI